MFRNIAHSIIADITFPNWTFVLEERDPGFLLYARFSAMEGQQTTRKWYISPWATKSELVQTALKLVITALEHEAREQFRYKDVAVFGPHFDVDRLHEIAQLKEHEDRRPECAYADHR